jgi:hypothetical protein
MDGDKQPTKAKAKAKKQKREKWGSRIWGVIGVYLLGLGGRDCRWSTALPPPYLAVDGQWSGLAMAPI